MNSRVVRVASLDLPELQPYCTLRRQQLHKDAGIFVAEGEKVVRRLLRSGLPVVSLLLTQEWYDRLFAGTAQAPTFDVFIAEKKLVETITGIRLHQGIMAVGRIPQERSLEMILGSLAQPFLLVALEGLQNAENVGVIARNCGALNVQLIIVGETSCSPYLRRAVRNSMGAVFSLPIVHTTDLIGTLTALRQAHATAIVAAHPHSSIDVCQLDLRRNLCIVLGSEDAGISPPVLSLADSTAAIPMHHDIDSLNVGSASAILLYEVGRQRQTRG